MFDTSRWPLSHSPHCGQRRTPWAERTAAPGPTRHREMVKTEDHLRWFQRCFEQFGPATWLLNVFEELESSPFTPLPTRYLLEYLFSVDIAEVICKQKERSEQEPRWMAKEGQQKTWTRTCSVWRIVARQRLAWRLLQQLQPQYAARKAWWLPQFS